MFQTFKASFGDDTFSGLLRLKHLGVRIITCGLIEGGLTYLTQHEIMDLRMFISRVNIRK